MGVMLTAQDRDTASLLRVLVGSVSTVNELFDCAPFRILYGRGAVGISERWPRVA